MNKRDIAQFHTKLLAWYKTHGRHHLPWRTTNDPYAVYVSEVMLQQTQVKTVLERFYEPFLKQFPTLEALAKAPQQKVLKAWEGLGYYSRARNLHNAAKILVIRSSPLAGEDVAQRQVGEKNSRVHPHPSVPDSFPRQGGSIGLPNSVDALKTLPGIGQNTAHAIAAFGFHQPVAIMEANVKRVLCRVFALKTPSPQTLWEKAEQLLDRKHPFDYNQAMMDIGSLVCTKTLPHCNICPLAKLCIGKATPLSFPAKSKKAKTPVRKVKLIALQNAQGEFYLTKRTQKLLNGMFGFMEVENSQREFTFRKKTYSIATKAKVGTFTHQYSHFTLDAEVVVLPCECTGEGFYSMKKIRKLPLSKADQKACSLIETNFKNSI